MSPSKEDGTAAAAAEQLGSISLGGSAERKDNDAAEPAAKNSNGPAAKKMCSACGKESDALKKCNGCKCVWYCDKKCQNKHRRKHREDCKRIMKELDKREGKLDVGTELDVGPIGKLPPREECPICMQVMPIEEALQPYNLCCGKKVCGGCFYQHQMKSGERARMTCAFCRTTMPESDEEILARLRKRADSKDPIAIRNLASEYDRGRYGLPVDRAKGIELLHQSADLGCLPSKFKLGLHHNDGIERNEEEALKYYKEAAEEGYIHALSNLGCMEKENGDIVAAMRHWRLAASGGFRGSMEALIECFEDGMLHHGDLAETLQAMYFARAEMRSEDRHQYIQFLKRTGGYKEEYNY